MTSELAASLLVAPPSLFDPNFAQSVVLMVRHEPEGSFGFIVNRSAPLSFAEVVSELELEGVETPPEVPVLSGGPVAPQTGWLLFDPERLTAPADQIIRVGDRLALSTSLEMLARLARSDDAERHLLLLGYAGWGPGQLDEEIREGTWLPVDLDERLLFETPLEERWQGALSAGGFDLRHLVAMPPSMS